MKHQSSLPKSTCFGRSQTRSGSASATDPRAVGVHSRRLAALGLAGILSLGLVACSEESGSSSSGKSTTNTSSSSAAAGADEMRTVTDARGTVEIPAKPKRIVSTSVVLTGTLLSLDAPVIGTSGSKPNTPGFDEHGWFDQWANIADERGVEPLFDSGNLDVEKIIAEDPDLIVVSATGGDSFAEQYDQLAAVAPTVVVDYNSHGWEEVTTTLGDMLNLQDKAAQVIKDFNSKVADAKKSITPPAEPVDIAVYSGNKGLNVGLPTAPQAKILEEVGVKVADTGVTAEKGRTDFAFTSEEQANQALTAEQILLVGNDQSDVDALLADQRFQNIPAVKNKQVYALGDPSFKLDYYAALDMLNHVVDIYKK